MSVMEEEEGEEEGEDEGEEEEKEEEEDVNKEEEMSRLPTRATPHRSFSPPSPPISFSARSSFFAQVSTCTSSSSFSFVFSSNC